MKESARIVIIGGGVIGLGIAYHLAERGVTDVVLIERNQLTSGTSWHAAGIVGPLRASLNLTHLASYATELFPELEARTGQSSGYQRTGGLWLARNHDRMTELRRIAHMGEVTGMHVAMIGPEEIAARAPSLSVEGLVGALWVDEDGQANPVDICAAYTKRARAAGIRIIEGVGCAGFEIANRHMAGVRLTTGETIRCETVINAGGAWARDIGALAGVPVPLQAVEHMYVVSEPIAGLEQPFPIVRDLDEGIYIKGDSGKLVLGGFEAHAELFNTKSPEGNRPFLEMPEDWEQFEPFMTAGLNLVPKLGDIGIRHFMNGPESFTPDTRPLMGESPYLRGFFVAAGFNSTGMMSSAGAGKAMAEWVIDGEPGLDLWALDIARFDRSSGAKYFVGKRMEESVADLFRMHWPYKQAKAGRNVRRSAFHRQFAEAGAVFGAPTGWERPLWFAPGEIASRRENPSPTPPHKGEGLNLRHAQHADLAESVPQILSPLVGEMAGRPEGVFATLDDHGEFRYSMGRQHWWPAAEREARAMAAGVGLFELSPFTKIDVQGRDALALLQYLCGNDIDIGVGVAVYTQMLNARGGIEADITVTRIGETHFRVTSGAATRQKDMAWISRHAEERGFDAIVSDVTSSEAVLAVMGPRSRELLQGLTDADLSNGAFAFATSQRLDIGMVNLRATRVSFVGELGFELYVDTELAESLLATIAEAGEPLGLAWCGHYALDGCRLEKGYRHWGHDIGPKETPLEAGLGFAVAWKKSGFLGEAALRKQKETGVAKRLMHFAVDGANPLLLHDEPIYRDGRYAGLTTSGGQGGRTGLALCLGYIASEPGETREALLQSTYEIAVAGERFPLKPLAAPPYDPAGQRLRS